MIALALALSLVPHLVEGTAATIFRELARRHHLLQTDLDYRHESIVPAAGITAASDVADVGDNAAGADHERRAESGGVVVPVENTIEFIIGAALVVLSIPGLWFYERQRARVGCLVSTARSTCQSASGQKALQSNHGGLVHVTGEDSRPAAVLEDPRFPGAVRDVSCVRLKTEVQLFQWVEQRLLSKRDGKDGKTAAASSQRFRQWSGTDYSSMGPQDGPKQNAAPPDLRIGTTTTNCIRVEYGPSFLLPDGLVDQCQDFEPAGAVMGSSVTTADGRFTFFRHTDGCFYWRQGPQSWTSAQVAQDPQVGDARVNFEYVPPGPLTILALQAEMDGGQWSTFWPYRLISRGICGINDGVERLELVAAGKKSREQLAREDQCLAGSRLCCGCNLVAGCCAGVLTPEIFRLFEGTRSVEECFQDATPRSSWGTWAIRACLWLTNFAGLLFTFSQLVVPAFDSFPMTATLGRYARPGICLMLTSAFSASTMSLAYLAYRPCWSLLWFMLVVAIVMIPNIVAIPSFGGEQSLLAHLLMSITPSPPGSRAHTWLDRRFMT